MRLGRLGALTTLVLVCAAVPATAEKGDPPSTAAAQPKSAAAGKAVPTEIAPAPAGRITAPYSAHSFASTIWLLPEVTVMGDNTVAGSTWIDVLNVSGRQIAPSIYILSDRGQLQAELSNYNTDNIGSVASGSRRSFLLTLPPPRAGSGTRAGWAIIEGGSPFIVVGHANGYETGSAVDSERSIAAYPVDCAKPAGIEYVCSLLADVRKND